MQAPSLTIAPAGNLGQRRSQQSPESKLGPDRSRCTRASEGRPQHVPRPSGRQALREPNQPRSATTVSARFVARGGRHARVRQTRRSAVDRAPRGQHRLRIRRRGACQRRAESGVGCPNARGYRSPSVYRPVGIIHDDRRAYARPQTSATPSGAASSTLPGQRLTSCNSIRGSYETHRQGRVSECYWTQSMLYRGPAATIRSMSSGVTGGGEPDSSAGVQTSRNHPSIPAGVYTAIIRASFSDSFT